MPVVNTLPLTSKCIFLTCFAKTELGTLNIFVFLSANMILLFVSREHRRRIAGERGPPFSVPACSLSMLLHSPLPPWHVARMARLLPAGLAMRTASPHPTPWCAQLLWPPSLGASCFSGDGSCDASISSGASCWFRAEG